MTVATAAPRAFTSRAAQRGHRIRVRLTATLAGYPTVQVASGATTRVK
jgi:hypothetical protein